jgi:ABC-type multidrug transport system ATPase subunit
MNAVTDTFQPRKLSISHLSKTYANGVVALEDVSLEIPSGMFGLLGPNGAGKSSLMRTLATLQEADQGTVDFDGVDVLRDKQAVRKMLGYLPQDFGVYPNVSALDLLDHLAILKGFQQKKIRQELVESLLHQVNLYEHRKKAVSKYSGGMRQRFGIAQCLIGQPKLIIVDEPTAGLDPGERNRFYDILSEVSEQAIVILSTHIVQDVQELCSHMAIMRQGKIMYCGTTEAALELVRGKVFRTIASKEDVETIAKEQHVLSNKFMGGKRLLHVYAQSNLGNHYEPAQVTLEDVYFAKLQSLLD